MIYNCKAFILGKRFYKENDELVWLYTDRYGLKIAQFKRSSKSENYTNSLQLFSIVKLNIKFLKKFTQIIDSEEIYIHRMNNIVNKYVYFNDLSLLLIRVLPRGKIVNNLFSNIIFIVRNFDKLTDLKVKLILPYIMNNIISYTGVNINLNNCTICNTQKSICKFSYTYMGLLCNKCYKEEPYEKNVLDMNELKTLVSFNRLPIEKFIDLDITKKQALFIRSFWFNIYNNFLGFKLKNIERYTK